MKKAIVILLVFTFLTGAASFVFAADSTSTSCGINWQEIKLTETQKAELGQLNNKILEIKKQMVQKYADYGYITQEQANEQFERKQTRFKEKNDAGQFFGFKGQNRQGMHSRQGLGTK